MARRRKAGNGAGGEAASLTLLESIRDELASLREDMNRGFKDLRGEVTDLRGEVTELRGDVRLLGSRMDNLLVGPLGDTVRRHEVEIAQLREEMAGYRRGR